MKYSFDKVYSKIGFAFMLGAMLKMQAAWVIAGGVRTSLEGDNLSWLFEYLAGVVVFVFFGNKSEK